MGARHSYLSDDIDQIDAELGHVIAVQAPHLLEMARTIHRVLHNQRSAPTTGDLHQRRPALALTQVQAARALGACPIAISRTEHANAAIVNALRPAVTGSIKSPKNRLDKDWSIKNLRHTLKVLIPKER
jgi:hypothetical protein